MAATAPRPHVFVTQPVSEHALKRLRAVARVTMFADSSRIIPKRTLIAQAAQGRHSVLPFARPN